ncbi:hypothetical protein [Pseudomonas sp. A014]|uniref:hypothetical protein n=1 Tax=Pseudomonas sp. A014 TaxID=3458058 RepID=UPI00403670D2
MNFYQAFHDESLSSWVFRLALWCNEFPLTPDSVNRLYSQSLLSSSFDPDYDLSGEFAAACHKALASFRPGQNIQHFFAPITPYNIPRYFRRSYCYECLCDQLEQAWSPAVLKRWGYTYYCTCEIHQVSLNDAECHVIKRANAAHDFFQFHTEHRLGKSSMRYSSEVQRVTLEVQGFLRRITSEPKVGLVDSVLLDFCTLFLKILLFPKFGVCSIPNAKRGISVEAPVWQHLHLGPFLATVTERQSAILLLGWVLEIPGSDVRLLPERSRAVLAHENIDFWRLGVSSSYLPDKIFKYSALLFSSLRPTVKSPAIEEFISGFVSRSIKDKQ